jgi:histidinol-phosphate phosphatase family protein
MDRDGVVNVSPTAGEYIRKWEEFKLIPETISWIRIFNALDLLVVVVTNQRGIARDIVLPDDLNDIHRRMKESLEESGAKIDDILYCPHELDVCDCRKPGTAMVREAERKWNIDLSRSIMIGDSDCDRDLAARCGMRFIRVRNGKVTQVIPDDEALLLDGETFALPGLHLREPGTHESVRNDGERIES